MGVNRRTVIGLLAAAGAGAAAVTAQVLTNSAPAPERTPRSADDELQIARAQRLRDAQRVALVKLPPFTEPAFRFRP